VLIRDEGEAWTAITQPAHAWLAGQVARHWAAPLPADVVLGIEQHDLAWLAWDREPPLHAEGGRAASFYEAPVEGRQAIWEGVAAKLEAQSPYAALLVSLHATNIHTRYLPPDRRPAGLLDGAAADQERLLAVLPDATREQAVRDADLLFCLDALSLSLCHRWDARDLPPVDGVGLRLEPQGQDRWTLDPWPLAPAAVEVAVDARTVGRRFDDEAAMRAALAATPFHRERYLLTPRPGRA
jgi:hypothetical protein